VEPDGGPEVLKNRMQPLELFWIFSKQINLKFLRFPVFQVGISSNRLLKAGWARV
jgi:hypothetical protein